CVQASQSFEALAQVGQLHRQMEPVEPMLRVGTQVALELTQALLPIREEHEFLVVLQVLTPEHRGQVSPRLRILARDEAEALGRPVRWNSLADDRHEVGLLVLPVSKVAAVDADGDRRRGRGQARTVSRTAGQRKAWLGAELRLKSTGDPQGVPTY